MRRSRLAIAFGLLVAAVAAVVAGVLVLGGDSDDGGSSGSANRERLPDLDQAAPGNLSIRTGQTSSGLRYLLGFESAAGNIGDGPLIVVGSRPSTVRPGMEVVQQIGSGSQMRARPVPETLRYVRSADHAHWHMLDFMRYELRGEDGRLVRPDRKTGFCLGDRYRLALPVTGARMRPTYTGECGKGRPGLLRLREGISVGYGDDYDAHLEGQEFDVTTLPSGRYLLVHRVNRGRALEESTYDNNASSLAFILSRPRGEDQPPTVEVVASCPETPACG